jgi:hypothetical protein
MATSVFQEAGESRPKFRKRENIARSRFHTEHAVKDNTVSIERHVYNVKHREMGGMVKTLTIKRDSVAVVAGA